MILISVVLSAGVYFTLTLPALLVTGTFVTGLPLIITVNCLPGIPGSVTCASVSAVWLTNLNVIVASCPTMKFSGSPIHTCVGVSSTSVTLNVVFATIGYVPSNI